MDFKRLHILCEGKTEKTFCDNILKPFLYNNNIIVSSSDNNGIEKWNNLKLKIEKKLKEDQSCIVSIFFDYYGITNKHQFPNWPSNKNSNDIYKKVNTIEIEMKNDLNMNINNRFIPYLQLHEFESLLFQDTTYFQNIFEDSNLDLQKLHNVFIQFPNPELINDNKTTSPSHRIQEIAKGFNKVIHGIRLAEEIGIQNMRNKCKHFNDWITKLENI